MSTVNGCAHTNKINDIGCLRSGPEVGVPVPVAPSGLLTFPGVSAVKMGGGCGFDRLSAVESGWFPEQSDSSAETP